MRISSPRPPTEVAAARFKDASELTYYFDKDTGHGGFGYTAMELETLSKYRLPVIAVVYNNNAWGTERAWQVAVQGSRPSVINCPGKKEFWLRETHPPGMLSKFEPGCMSYYH